MVPQIQFQFLDMVMEGVCWGAAALSRWCCLCQGATCQSWRLLEEFSLLRCQPRRAVRTQRGSHVEILALFLHVLHFWQFVTFFFLLLSGAGAHDDEEFFIIEGSV